MPIHEMEVPTGSGDPRSRLACWRSEEGIAYPAAMMMLLIIGSIAFAMTINSVSANNQASRDRGVKRAVAAGEAGLNVATYRMNKLTPSALLCVVRGVASQLLTEPLQVDGWCRAQTEELGDGASYSYRVSAGLGVLEGGQSLLQRKVVATGCVLPGATSHAQCIANGGVKRRVYMTIASPGGQLFPGKGVLSKETLLVRNNGYLESDAASNDDVVINNNAEICGNVTYGPAPDDIFDTGNNAIYNCPGKIASKAQQEFLLNPVDANPARLSNDNNRIGNLDTTTGSVTWNPVSKVLKVGNNASITLTGDTYSFCYLEVRNNARLIIASRAPGRPPLKIYIDRPELCALAGSDKGRLNVSNNASVENQTADPSMLQIYVEGSTLLSTLVEIENNAAVSMHMSVYAPNSIFLLENNGEFHGAVAAKRVTVENNADFFWDARSGNITTGTSLLYQRQKWLECTVQSNGSAPDAGC
jgi:hypothetical protein